MPEEVCPRHQSPREIEKATGSHPENSLVALAPWPSYQQTRDVILHSSSPLPTPATNLKAQGRVGKKSAGVEAPGTSLFLALHSEAVPSSLRHHLRYRIGAEPTALMNGKQAAQPVPGANDIQASFT